MKIGMLWYDDSPRRSFQDKVAQAINYYRAKYGRLPNTCYVHPSCLPDEGDAACGLKLVGAEDILPHHFWLGVAPVTSPKGHKPTS